MLCSSVSRALVDEIWSKRQKSQASIVLDFFFSFGVTLKARLWLLDSLSEHF